ncbi:hypothetical protein Tco_1041285 [Tanacetum coccineum]|uniref:Transmembrane protein n=1 Tax=Tanacetum coccineum TaxID=301880 RepID=A0ABQ5GGD6_9ASTR
MNKGKKGGESKVVAICLQVWPREGGGVGTWSCCWWIGDGGCCDVNVMLMFNRWWSEFILRWGSVEWMLDQKLPTTVKVRWWWWGRWSAVDSDGGGK